MVAAGVRQLVTGAMVKRASSPSTDQPRVDEETGRVRLVGDLDFDSVAEKAEVLHARTGGVGPIITDVWLLRNTAEAAALQS